MSLSRKLLLRGGCHEIELRIIQNAKSPLERGFRGVYFETNNLKNQTPDVEVQFIWKAYFICTLRPIDCMRLRPRIRIVREIRVVTVIIPAIGILFVVFNRPTPPDARPAVPMRIVPTNAEALPRFR